MNRTTRGVICTLVGGILWGFSGACGQYLFTNYQVDSAWLTVARMLGAGSLLVLFSFFAQRERLLSIWKNKRDALQLVLFAIFGLSFSQFSYLTAISYSNAGTATVLQYLGPVLIMVLVCFWKKKLPEKRELAAIILAVLGTFLLATHGNPSTMVLSKPGLFWGLVAAVSLAFYTLLPGGIIPRWGSLVVTGWGMLIGGIILGTVINFFGITVNLDGKGWLALGGVVILGTLFSYTLYLQGVADIGAVKASVMASVEPVSATIFSVCWLGSRFQIIDLAGFVCIMTTVFLLARRKD